MRACRITYAGTRGRMGSEHKELSVKLSACWGASRQVVRYFHSHPLVRVSEVALTQGSYLIVEACQWP